jgi:hypothetical protein
MLCVLMQVRPEICISKRCDAWPRSGGAGHHADRGLHLKLCSTVGLARSSDSSGACAKVGSWNIRVVRCLLPAISTKWVYNQGILSVIICHCQVNDSQCQTAHQALLLLRAIFFTTRSRQARQVWHLQRGPGKHDRFGILKATEMTVIRSREDKTRAPYRWRAGDVSFSNPASRARPSYTSMRMFQVEQQKSLSASVTASKLAPFCRYLSSRESSLNRRRNQLVSDAVR